jgi:AI-2 transport protein TqsA
VGTEKHETRIQTICLLFIVAIAIGAALFLLRVVIIPFILAIFSALALNPWMAFQRRYLRLPHPVVVLTTFLTGLVALGLLGALISISVRQLLANADAYQQMINHLLDRVMALAEGYGIEPITLFDTMAGLPVGSVSGIAANLAKGLIDVLSQGFLVLLFLFFLLLGTAQNTEPKGGILGEIERRVRRYIVAKTVFAAAAGSILGGVLAVLGIDLALMFGLFAFLLNFIPNLGSPIAILLPLPVVLVNPESTLSTVMLTIGLPGLADLLISNLIEPKVVGGSLNLHPATVLICLIVWGMMWGIIGMFLAIPLTAVIQILFERFEYTMPIAELLAGQLDRWQAD